MKLFIKKIIAILLLFYKGILIGYCPAATEYLGYISQIDTIIVNTNQYMPTATELKNILNVFNKLNHPIRFQFTSGSMTIIDKTSNITLSTFKISIADDGYFSLFLGVNGINGPAIILNYVNEYYDLYRCGIIDNSGYAGSTIVTINSKDKICGPIYCQTVSACSGIPKCNIPTNQFSNSAQIVNQWNSILPGQSIIGYSLCNALSGFSNCDGTAREISILGALSTCMPYPRCDTLFYSVQNGGIGACSLKSVPLNNPEDSFDGTTTSTPILLQRQLCPCSSFGIYRVPPSRVSRATHKIPNLRLKH